MDLASTLEIQSLILTTSKLWRQEFLGLTSEVGQHQQQIT
jgi:hypothetical protein